MSLVSVPIEQLKSPPPAPLLVLLAEDDRLLSESLVSLLSAEGYHVTTAATGEEALERARASQFDLMICDVRLDDQDGLSVFEEVRQLHPAIAGIVLTGYASEEHTLRAAKLQVEEYIKKPFELESFLSIIDRVAQNKVRQFESSLRELGTHQAILHLSISLLAPTGPYDREVVQMGVRRFLKEHFPESEDVLEQTVLGCLAVKEALETQGLEFPPGYGDLLSPKLKQLSQLHALEDQTWDGLLEILDELQSQVVDNLHT